MIIKIDPLQISSYWDVIKFTALKANQVSESDAESYCRDLLIRMLNSKSICLMSVNEKREIRRVMIVSFLVNTVTNVKTLFIDSMYSFKPVGEEVWKEESVKLYNWARSEGCKFIETVTTNPLVVKHAKRWGFKECSRNYRLPLDAV